MSREREKEDKNGEAAVRLEYFHRDGKSKDLKLSILNLKGKIKKINCSRFST